MKPDTRTVIDLFERDVRYVVPLYQRPYVWDEDHQWALLWDDIRVLLDHRMSHDAVGAHSHFLGAIVVEQDTPIPGEIPLFTVIDGQQRLTTLQIILAAAVYVASAHGYEDDAGLLRDLLFNDRRKAKGDRLFKVWPTNANRAAFSAVIYPEGTPPGQADDPANLIEEAYAYFVQALDEWVTDELGPTDEAARIETVRICLSDLLKVVSITLEPGDNAQVIFETLNARSTQLLALDLVKNAVFREASRQALDVDALYERAWKPQLDDDYWRAERRQGRLNRAQGELFLMHWLSMKRRRVVPATELFLTFRNDFLGPGSTATMAEFIQELCADAATYRAFDSQAEGTVEGDFFSRLQTLDVSTILPLVLLLYTESSVTVGVRRRALQALESWLVRRTLLRLTTKDYNNQFAALMKLVADDPSRADEAIVNHLTAADSDTNRWPRDADVLDYFDTHSAYGNVSQPRLVMLFRALERSRYSDKVEALSVPRSLSIEHVMPQKWHKHWPLEESANVPEEEASAERDARIHKLGNLTVTTLPLNQEMSHAAWRVKQGLLNRASKLLLNAELVEKYRDRFDERSIDRRTRRLARRICAIWPGPEAAHTPRASEDASETFTTGTGEFHRNSTDVGRVTAAASGVPEEVAALVRRRSKEPVAALALGLARLALARPAVELRVQKSRNEPSYFQIRSALRKHVIAYVNPASRDVRVDFRLPPDHNAGERATPRADQAYGIQLVIRNGSDLGVAERLLDDALALDGS